MKGVNFEGIQDVADPVEMAEFYNQSGADELVFYDITASVEGRKIFTDILTEAAKRVFIPLTVGGGISTLDDFDRVLKCGADKVSVNSGAIKNPELITEAAHRYGDQCVVLSMDVKRVGDEYHVFKQGGRVDTGIDALEWAESGVRRGAGELVVNSIDTDGVKQGFDIPMHFGDREACRCADYCIGRRGKERRLFRSLPVSADRRGTGGEYFPPEGSKY